MAINLKTGVTVGREDEEIDVIFTRKGLKKHDNEIREKMLNKILKLRNCKDADCFECAFGNVEGCLLERLKEKHNG